MPLPQSGFDEDAMSSERELMVRQQIAERGISSPRILEAFLRVPRHLFVPPDGAWQAYEDRPLYIGHGQTISQPYIVALMTEALELGGGEKVLDVGTGSGYQAAILAELAEKVYTVERIPELAEKAQSLLGLLGYENVEFLVGDGTEGWAENAPYDAAVVAAAAPEVPESLKGELRIGGRMVIPVGRTHSQVLETVTRTDKGFVTREICPCIFVKLIGREGYRG